MGEIIGNIFEMANELIVSDVGTIDEYTKNEQCQPESIAFTSVLPASTSMPDVSSSSSV